MNELLRIYALCVLVLCLKMLAISCYQGFFRIRGRVFTNPEDAAFFNRTPQPEELPQVVRAARAWANDLENIPLFFCRRRAVCRVGNCWRSHGCAVRGFYPGAGGTHDHVSEGVPALAHAGIWGGGGVSYRLGRYARLQNVLKGTGLLKR